MTQGEHRPGRLGTASDVLVRAIGPGDPLWAAHAAHLHASNQARWVLDELGAPTGAFHFLVALSGDRPVGNLTLREQVVTVPPSEWAGERTRDLSHPDGGLLRETFVMTFHVDETHRRRGVGAALQRAALRATAALGCHQMRSWSSLDRPDNYRLKLRLGFAAHPATDVVAGGLVVSGVYFVRRVEW